MKKSLEALLILFHLHVMSVVAFQGIFIGELFAIVLPITTICALSFLYYGAYRGAQLFLAAILFLYAVQTMLVLWFTVGISKEMLYLYSLPLSSLVAGYVAYGTRTATTVTGRQGLRRPLLCLAIMLIPYAAYTLLHVDGRLDAKSSYFFFFYMLFVYAALTPFASRAKLLEWAPVGALPVLAGWYVLAGLSSGQESPLKAMIAFGSAVYFVFAAVAVLALLLRERRRTTEGAAVGE